MAAISVIVPVYKVEPYLHRCVDSILNQTFTDFELILVDDGSPDNCGAICDEYAAKDSRVHVIHQKNSGVSAARNAGLARAFANGCQWVAFVDSDDWVHPCYLEILHGAAVENGVMLSCCEFCPVQEESQIPDSMMPDVPCVKIQSPEEVFCSRDAGIILGYVCRWLFHINLLRDVQFPTGIRWEDVYILPHIIFETEKVASVNMELYYYWRHNGSVTLSEWSKRSLDVLHSYEHCLRVCEKQASRNLCVFVAGDYIRRILDQYFRVQWNMVSGKEKKEILYSVRERLKEELKRYAKEISFPWSISVQAFCILHPPLCSIYLAIDKMRAILHDRIQMLKKGN